MEKGTETLLHNDQILRRRLETTYELSACIIIKGRAQGRAQSWASEEGLPTKVRCLCCGLERAGEGAIIGACAFISATSMTMRDKRGETHPSSPLQCCQGRP